MWTTKQIKWFIFEQVHWKCFLRICFKEALIQSQWATQFVCFKTFVSNWMSFITTLYYHIAFLCNAKTVTYWLIQFSCLFLSYTVFSSYIHFHNHIKPMCFQERSSKSERMEMEVCKTKSDYDPKKWNLVWPNIIYFAAFHIFAIYGVYLLLFNAKFYTVLFGECGLVTWIIFVG